MSADRICPCPACGDWGLREYTEIGMPEPGDQAFGLFTIDYFGQCRSCAAEFRYGCSIATDDLRTK